MRDRHPDERKTQSKARHPHLVLIQGQGLATWDTVPRPLSGRGKATRRPAGTELSAPSSLNTGMLREPR